MKQAEVVFVIGVTLFLLATGAAMGSRGEYWHGKADAYAPMFMHQDEATPPGIKKGLH